MTVLAQHHRFNVDEYHWMARSGILKEDDRVELIEGEVFEMSPIGNRHAACVRRLNHLLSLACGRRALVDAQNPLRLDDLSEPQPDLQVLCFREDFYSGRPPAPDDVLLVVEVADRSLAFDLEIKVPLYGRRGVSELWLVDLGSEAVIAYRDPGPEGYRSQETFRRGHTLAPRALPEIRLTVDSILG